MLAWPGRPGFSRISTRRTASSALISAPEAMTSARTSSYFQMAGTQRAGSRGTRLCSDSHSGAMCFLAMRA